MYTFSFRRSLRKGLLLVVLTIAAMSAAWAQTTFPFTIQNTSPFPDRDLYVAVVGETLSTGSGVWIDLKTSAVNAMSAANNTVKGPVIGGNMGPGGNALYANCFTRLTDIPNKTFNLPGIKGCRIFIAVGQQLYFYFHPTGGYSSPSHTNPTDPNTGIRYELIELTNDQYGFFGNTTRVDSYQYPMGLELYGGNGYAKKVGELKTHEQIVAMWSSNVPTEFQKCLDPATGIIMAPSKTKEFADGTIGTMPVPGPYVNYLKPYIDQVWAKYTNEDLIFNSGDAGVFRGRVSGERFTFNCISGGFVGRTGVISRKPTTQEALEGKGVLDQTVNDRTVDLAVQAQITAALNRHVINVTTPNVGQQDFSNAATYYNAAPCNYYSRFWHLPGIAIDQLTYGFAYDDVFDKSSSLHTPSPTRAVAVFGGYANASSDNTPPTTPSGLVASSKTAASVTLTWGASADNVGVTGYEVYVNAETSPRTTVSGLSTTVSGLTAATSYSFRVRAKDAAGNASAYSNTVTVTTDGTSGTPTIPGTIEAENYTAMFGVEKETCTDIGGGQNVGYIEPNDWMDYTVNVTAAGTYAVEARVASEPGGGKFQIRNAAGTVLATVDVPLTGGWQNWISVQTTVALSAGVQTIRIYALAANWNINRLTFSGSVAPTNVALNKTVTVSSTELPETPASAAVDGNLTTRWSSAFGDGQWIYVNLGARYTISQVKVTWEDAYGKDYLVQVSDDASNWTTVRTITNNSVLVNNHTGLSATGRYVRIYGQARGTTYGYSIFELEVYGVPAAALAAAASAAITPEFYPNPVQQTLYTRGLEDGTRVSIISTTTRTPYTRTTRNEQLDINDLPRGIYILTYTLNGKDLQWRFTKD